MPARLTRLLAAVLLAGGGLIHYDLWRDGYRYVPTVGPLFIVHFVASTVIAAAVVMIPKVGVAAGGMLFAAGSLAVLVLSHTVGVFGFSEQTWSPEAMRSLASSVGAIVSLAVALQLERQGAPDPS
jgi:hypothetical protein